MTDDERELRAVFLQKIVPAALRARERGVSYFPLGPEAGIQSYWKSRPEGQGYVFQIGDDLSSELHELWKDDPELRALAEDLAGYARAAADRSEESADVSSFIYAMF